MQPPILVAEDEESDSMILRLAFERAGLPHPLVLVRDGQEVIDYLSATGSFANREVHPIPCLLLLDLKMPRMSGLDVLQWLKTRPEFKDIPAVVFSSSPADADIRQAKQMGAQDYFVKPHALRELVNLLHTLRDRWLTPKGEPAA